MSENGGPIESINWKEGWKKLAKFLEESGLEAFKEHNRAWSERLRIEAESKEKERRSVERRVMILSIAKGVLLAIGIGGVIVLGAIGIIPANILSHIIVGFFAFLLGGRTTRS